MRRINNRNADDAEPLSNGTIVFGAVSAEMLNESRGPLRMGTCNIVFGIEEAQWILLQPSLINGRETICYRSKMFCENSEVAGAAGSAPDRIEMHLNVTEANRLQVRCTELDHFDIDTWPCVTDRLNVELRELTISTLLRSIVAEEFGYRHKPNRLRFRPHAMLKIGAYNPSSYLRAECERR